MWLDSVSRYARCNTGMMKYLLKAYNVSRKIDFAQDFNEDGPLNQILVKKEDENGNLHPSAASMIAPAFEKDKLSNCELTFMENMHNDSFSTQLPR